VTIIRVISIEAAPNARMGKVISRLIACGVLLGSVSLPLMATTLMRGNGDVHAALAFYSPADPPPGMKSIEPVFGQLYWNGWVDHPPSYLTSWPAPCLKWQATIANNQSVVFLGDPASASESNTNATRQSCEISANQLLFLSVYDGECDNGQYPNMSSPELLKCAQDSNKVIKLMEVTVDGVPQTSNIVRESTSVPFDFFIPATNVYDAKPPQTGTHSAMSESYYLFFKPLEVGNHTIKLEVIRAPLQPGAEAVEHDIAMWNINVTSPIVRP